MILLIIIVALIFIVINNNKKERKLIEQVTPISRGERSERQVIRELLSMGIHPKAIYHDVYLRKANGDYTQIDLVVATKAGIIVFEIKDYSGWIFGNDSQTYWTQILAYGQEKHRFYNPIMQNSGHIATIKQWLPHNQNVPYYSVVVFYGTSEFRNVTINTPNTFVIYPFQIKGTIQQILQYNAAYYGNKQEVMNVLSRGVENGNNPKIVSSQVTTAYYAARNKPQSTYDYRPRIYHYIRHRRRFF